MGHQILQYYRLKIFNVISSNHQNNQILIIFFRFVLLEDCRHIIESKALDKHLVTSPEGGEIVQKVCPICKSAITKTLRYMNHVKRTCEDIINVKTIVYGSLDTIMQKRGELYIKLRDLLHESQDALHAVGKF